MQINNQTNYQNKQNLAFSAVTVDKNIERLGKYTVNAVNGVYAKLDDFSIKNKVDFKIRHAVYTDPNTSPATAMDRIAVEAITRQNVKGKTVEGKTIKTFWAPDEHDFNLGYLGKEIMESLTRLRKSANQALDKKVKNLKNN